AGGGTAALVFLGVAPPASAHLGLDPLAQRRDRLGAHAVQAGGGLVGALVELGAGAADREHHLQRRPLHLGVLVDGDAAAVVGHAQAAVHLDADVDVLAVARQ